MNSLIEDGFEDRDWISDLPFLPANHAGICRDSSKH
jgi:hypothetical protein